MCQNVKRGAFCYKTVQYLSSFIHTFAEHLRRTFNVGKWNSLVLPVSMTAAAVKATFGNDATAIQEGKLYIIKPTNKMPTKAENGLDINECFPQITQRIYNLNGQLVGTSIANLPAGIYIVSGKKIIVK